MRSLLPSLQRDLVFPDGGAICKSIARKRRSMPADYCVWLEDAQPVPLARPAMGQPNPHQPVRLLKAETTRRALLKDRDLMAEDNDLRLLSKGPKRGGDQSRRAMKMSLWKQ